MICILLFTITALPLPFPQAPPLWAQVLTAVKSCFFVDDPERITLDERKAAVSALKNAVCPDDDQTIDIMLKGDPMGPQLKIDDFEIGKYLGEGGFGQVFSAHHVKSGSIVALKRVLIPGRETWDYLSLHREIDIPKNLAHDHILKYHGGFKDDTNTFAYLVLEYAPGGSLREVLKHGPLSEKNALPWKQRHSS